MTTLRDAAQAVLDDFEAVIREADAPSRGMRVPFFGTFASAIQLPSVMKGIRWHARQLRSALSYQPTPHEPRATELLRDLVESSGGSPLRYEVELQRAREFLSANPVKL